MKLAVCALALVAACSHAPPESPPARRAFYYWRTTFALSEPERAALHDLGVTRLYVRAFDVVWHDAPEFAGPLAFAPGQEVPAGIEVVPVVFVRNEVVQQLAPDGAGPLARSIAGELHALHLEPHEIQLDCDWTDKTQRAFFALVRELRTAAPGVALSATIRLHQVKYRERTGVPPVDRGTLMFYNMGKFSPDPDARVIFDPATASQYLGRVSEYPLPLDAALPIWSWVVQVRDERIVDLLQSTDPDELARLDFLQARSADSFVATRTAWLHGVLLREGDVLNVERTGPAETRLAAEMLAPHLPPVTTPRTVTLFDLSQRNVARYGTPALDQIYRVVR